VTGIGQIANTQSLTHNGLFPPILGLPDFPHRDTLRIFLWRFGSTELQQLEAAHDQLRADLPRRLGLRYSAIVDAARLPSWPMASKRARLSGTSPSGGRPSPPPPRSSPVKAGWGSPWGPISARTMSTSPRTPGASGRDSWRSPLPRLPPPHPRAPRWPHLRQRDCPPDEGRLGYAIVVRMTQPLRYRMVAARYHAVAPEWEAAEIGYTPFRWEGEHCFVAVRRPVALEPEDVHRRLFTFNRYPYYRALVTNRAIIPEAVYRFYCDRGFQELLLREFKNSYHLAQIPTRSFWANATYLEMILWAYDLVLAFQSVRLPPEVRH
jgi:hypothetical protein